MTDKRFIIDDDEYIRDNTDFSTYLEMEDICDLLNDLDNEIKELKEAMKRLMADMMCGG